MIPVKKVEELVLRHKNLESELSSGNLDKKLFASKSKEYSDINEIINYAKKYIEFEKNKKDLEKIINDNNSEKEIKEMAETELNELFENNELIEKGLYELDDTIESLLSDHPDYKLINIPNVNTKVTVEQLLTMTSGISDWSKSEDLTNRMKIMADQNWKPANNLQYITKKFVAPGSYNYSYQLPSGCDSISTAIITINTSTFDTTSIIATDNYLWPIDGVNYTSSGIYVNISTDSLGCNLTQVLNLTINISLLPRLTD